MCTHMNYSHDIGNALIMFCHDIYFHNQVIEIKPASDVSANTPLVILTNCLLTWTELALLCFLKMNSWNTHHTPHSHTLIV